MTQPSFPIGVFDSGIGGLSILAALQQALPHERFVYYSDAQHAPYGERSDAFIEARCRAVTADLLAQHRIKALVVACNTATTVAIHQLREQFAALPIIGVEPAIKPAVRATQSGHIAVLATARTLQSGKYQALRQSLAGNVQITDVACVGLAGAIETEDAAAIEALCARFMAQALEAASDAAVDTVVLGCTHYPLVRTTLQRLAAPSVRFIDSAIAVARHTALRLQTEQLLAADAAPASGASAELLLQTSGDLAFLQRMARRYLPAPAHLLTPVEWPHASCSRAPAVAHGIAGALAPAS